MNKFIIICDTAWCGTDSRFRALAESKEDLYDLAEELAYDNFGQFANTFDILEDLGYNVDDLTEEEIDSIVNEIDETAYYNYEIEECDDEEWDSYGDDYIYTINNEENEW